MSAIVVRAASVGSLPRDEYAGLVSTWGFRCRLPFRKATQGKRFLQAEGLIICPPGSAPSNSFSIIYLVSAWAWLAMGNIEQRLRAGSHKYPQALRADHGQGHSNHGSALPSSQKTLILEARSSFRQAYCTFEGEVEVLQLWKTGSKMDPLTNGGAWQHCLSQLFQEGWLFVQGILRPKRNPGLAKTSKWLSRNKRKVKLYTVPLLIKALLGRVSVF